MSRIIEVVISPQGETTVQTKGYSGSDCLAATKFLEEALGVVGSDRKTSEFYGQTTQNQQQLNEQ